jgi:uncharacterized protein (DUF1499 family)|tara:strand:+ start:998 stop:1195 length:198 start_codon:yes stop_codon:yes gene_type:complete
MKNRDIIMRRLEKAEGNIEKLHFFLQRQSTREQFEEVIQVLRETISETKMFVDSEPKSTGELNNF